MATPSRESAKEIALFVFIDALGWQLLLRNPEFLAEELPHRSRLESIFGYSSTCDPTILTGLMPEDHGHFSFFVYDPAKSPFGLCRWLRFLPKSITSRGRVRRLMSRGIRRLYGFTGYFQIYNMPFDKLPLFDYSEKRDLYQPGGINSGARTIFDDLRARGLPFHLSDWRAGEESNVETLERALSTGGPRFAYLYLAAMDAILHADGTDSARVRAKLEWYARRLRGLLQVARRQYSAVRLYVFSDHGMTDVRETCDLIPRIEATGLVFGRDYAAVYDSTMARFWFLSNGSREKIEAALAAEPRGRILTEDDLAVFRCRFQNQRYGHLFFLLDPGVLLCPSFLGEKPLAGMHGYTPADKDTDAAFLTNVELPETPRRLDDLYGLMLREAERIAGGEGADG
ncbi:MAG: alkaline phosphatase family protein [Candidatus Sumerlaeia bacterium]|nr:alkaline phosphatase family protein [Candidatus Sumerlaeia bacterium]